MANPESPIAQPFADELIVKIWEKAIDTQMHFNEMSVKSRQLGLTFVGAALGLSILLMSNDKDYYFNLSVWGTPIHLHVSPIIILGSLIAISCVRILDLNVYHKMLRGAVSFGEDIENTCMVHRLGLNHMMTSSVSLHSRFSVVDLKSIKPNVYRAQFKSSAFEKIKSFYFWLQFFLFSIALISALILHFSFVKV
jgi:hypothetical protein